MKKNKKKNFCPDSGAMNECVFVMKSFIRPLDIKKFKNFIIFSGGVTKKNLLILFIKEKVETHHQNNKQKKMIFKEVKHLQFVLKSIIDKRKEKKSIIKVKNVK